jgi:hypothetical protein
VFLHNRKKGKIKMHHFPKFRHRNTILSLLLAIAMILSSFPGLTPGAFAASIDSTGSEITTCIRYSQPAICCNSGDSIDLSRCAVQFGANVPMTESGIQWFYQGASVSTFSPAQKGVYKLQAQHNGKEMEIYPIPFPYRKNININPKENHSKP